MRKHLLLAGCVGIFAAFIVPVSAFAQIVTVCTGLTGCGLPPTNVLYNVLPRVAAALITIAAGCSVIYIIVAGTEMMLSGEEGGTKGKTRVIYALGGLGLCLTASTIVAAVASESVVGSRDLLVSVMVSVARVILTLFNVLFVIIIIYNGLTMVLSNGKADGYNKAIGGIKWAIAGAVLVNLSRAIVQAFLNLNL